jgi:hypothetical protein
MAQLHDRQQLVSIWNRIAGQDGTGIHNLATRLTSACSAEGINVSEAEAETLIHSLQLRSMPSDGQGRLLLTALAGDQTLRCAESYGVLAQACPDGVTVAVVQKLLQIFALEPSQAQEIAVMIDRDGGGLVSREDFLAFLPDHFCRHPRSYHASHTGYRLGGAAAPTVARSPEPSAPEVSSATASRATPPPAASTAFGGGTSPIQLQIGLFRLLQGAAYRSFRASYSANSETHLRAYDLPYTIENFGRFVEAAVDLYSALGVVDADARQPLDDLRSSVQTAVADLHQRMESWPTLELSDAMRDAEGQIESELEVLDHEHQLFAALVEVLLVAGLQGHDPLQLSAEDLHHHELSRLRHLEDHRELSDHRHTPAGGDSQRPFLETWQRVIVDESDTRYAGAIMPTRYWYEDFMPKLLRACSVRSAADIAALDAETEADLDAWFIATRDAGEFDRYAPAMRQHFLECPRWVKQELRLAWRLTRHYLNGVQKRREREEFGRGDGYICEYVAFLDVYLGRSDIADSEMRLSFPYYLGPATWRLLHTSAELIAERPDAEQGHLVDLFKRFFGAMATMYPCPYCRFHLNRYVVRNKEVHLYPIEYLLLGPQDSEQPHIEVTVDQKLSVIHDGASLRLFVWKLHNTVSASIARSEPWFHRDDHAHYTTRYWPSLDSELARAQALAQQAIETDRISRIYGVLKHAAHLGVLRDELQLALHRPGSDELRQVWERAEAIVAAAEQAVLSSRFLQQSYHYNPSLELEDPHFTPEEEALARSGFFVET